LRVLALKRLSGRSRKKSALFQSTRSWGFALLGILYMNIQAFSMVSAAYMNPTA